MISGDDVLPPALPGSQTPTRLLPNLCDLRVYYIVAASTACRPTSIEQPFAQLLPQLRELVTRRGCRSYAWRGSDRLHEAQTLRKLSLFLPGETIDSTQHAWLSGQVVDINIVCRDWAGWTTDEEDMKLNTW